MISRVSVNFIYLFICINAFAQVQTNLQIVEVKTTAILDSIGSNLPDSLKAIGFKTNVNDRGIKSFLLNQFAQKFAKNKITVSLDSAAYKVIFENFDVKIEYQENKTGMLGLNRNLKRIIAFNASGFLIDNNRMIVIDPFQFDTIHEDIIQSEDLDTIENGPYTFCQGSTVSAVAWSKYIVPGIVIVSVASIVYLLFTMRF